MKLMMSEHSSRRAKEWSRCSEGFSDVSLTKANNDSRKQIMKRKSAEPSTFSHGNIFEKLFGGSSDDKTCSQSIDWSSSEGEHGDADKPGKPVDNKSPSPTAKKPRRRSSPRNARRKPASTRKTNTRHQKAMAEDVEIAASSDTESADKQHDTQATSSVKSSDANICGFDSDSEISKSQICTPVKVSISPNESQASILAVESQSPSPSVTQTASTGLKASDWIKSLQLKTPSKSQHNENKLEPEDSAKKKKKHARGGLSEQLSRLQNRDKSAVRMWSHQQSKPSPSQDSKSLCLEVINHENLYSMQIVRCRICNTLTSGTSTVETNSGNSNEPGTSTQDAGKQDIRLVMFPASQSEQLNLTIGSRFKVFPPWQQLELNDGRQILLCTKYCQVIEQPSASKQIKPQVTETKTTCQLSVRAKWNCPCVQGLCRSASLCPAYQFPSVAGLIQVSSSSRKTQGKDSNCNLVKSPTKSSTSHLHTISSRPGHMTRSVSERSLSVTAVCDSILKSIEGRRQAGDLLSDVDSTVVTFRGHVHRYITTCEKDGNKRQCLFVEDSAGTVCQVTLTGDSMSKQDIEISSLEGNTFQFHGLTVHDRITRDKDPSLFSMVDCVWSGKCSIDSQDSAQSQNQSMESHTLQPQSYCYILSDHHSQSVTIKPSLPSILPSKPPEITILNDLNTLLKPCRCTCIVRLLYVHKQFGKLGSYTVYVTDCSVKGTPGYVQIPLARDFHFQPETLHTGACTIIELRDLVLNQVGVKADCYSRLSIVSNSDPVCLPGLWNTIRQLKATSVILKPFGSTLNQDDLCFIKGLITSVDEDSAYSWEACTECGSDQLQNNHTSGQLTCLVCKNTMTEAVTKMKMEVIVVCDTSKHEARVDLMQATIESLLPADEEDDEGYELSSVLDKSLGPIHCIVTAMEDKHVALQQIELLQ